MSGSFPSGITVYTNPAPGDTTATEVGTRTHSELHGDVCDDLEQVMAKLGTGASLPAGLPGVLRSAAGGSEWAQIQSGDITDGAVTNVDVNAAAAIALTKLAHVGAGNVLKSTGAANVGAQVVNADVAAGAAITVSKLAAGGTANRVVGTTDGTTMAMSQISGSMLAADTITASHLAPDCVGTSELADGAVDTANLAANAVTQTARASISTSTTSGSLVDVTGSGITIATSTGDVLLLMFDGTISHPTAGAIVTVTWAITSGATLITRSYQVPTAIHAVAVAMSDVVAAGSGSFQHKLQYSTNSPAGSGVTLVGQMKIVVLRR